MAAYLCGSLCFCALAGHSRGSEGHGHGHASSAAHLDALNDPDAHAHHDAHSSSPHASPGDAMVQISLTERGEPPCNCCETTNQSTHSDRLDLLLSDEPEQGLPGPALTFVAAAESKLPVLRVRPIEHVPIIV
jgi:hypothetical protein